MRILGILATVVAVAACGSMNHKKTSTKPVVSEASAKEFSASLPAATIVRVPVGADGKEVNEKAELRLANSASISNDNVVATFEAAQAPTVTVDELDATSSTASFFGWRRCCGYNRNYINYNWNYYSPTYYNYGYYYNYNYAGSYCNGGYNYYQYNSGFSSGYSGYGVAPGYGYPTPY